MKKLIALLLALVMVLGMVACGSQENSEAATEAAAAENAATDAAAEPADSAETKYLRLSLQLNDTLSGIKPITSAGYEFTHQLLFGNLMRFDMDTNSYVPALAEKVDISDDGLVYTVTLKDNYFHDGEPLTADDVVFTYTNVICGSGLRCAKLALVEGYEAAKSGETDTVAGIAKVDDKTVTFTLVQPNSIFVEALANSCFAILPEHILGGMTPTEISENADFWSNPVGSGAYMVNEAHYPDYMTLKAFDKYYDPAGIENILLTHYADTESLYAAAIAGEHDYILGVEEEAANNIAAQNSDISVKYVDSNYRRWFMINCSDTAGDNATHPSLKNAKVRQALNMLLDKEAIATLYGEIATVLTTEINPASPWCNTDIPAWERDVEGAVAILKEENFDFNTPIRLFANYTDQITADFLELVVQNLAEGGVQATYTIDGNWEPYLSVQDYDFRYAGGMSNNLIDYYSCMAISGLGTYTAGNYFYEDPTWIAYQTERYDNTVNAWLGTTDPAEQKAIMDQLQVYAYEDMYNIPLYCLNGINLINSAHFSGMPEYASDFTEIVDYHFSEWQLVG